MRHLGGELVPDETRVGVEQLLLGRGQQAQDLLDTEELINFRFAREESISIGDFPHDAANSPNVYFLPILVAE